MWFIFLVSCIAVALAAMLVIWIGNKVYLSMKKLNQKYEKEIKEEKENEKNER